MLHSSFFIFSPLTVSAQTAEEADSAVAKKKVHVAFRDVDADHLLGGVSYVDMEELSKKDYTMSSLEDMMALVGGFNGNNLWGMDNERLDNNDNSNMPLVIIDGVKRPSNNVLPSEIEQVTFLKGAQAVVLYGSKAAKGAILITTKRGKVDGLRIDANANTGWYVAKEFPEYIGSAEYMTLYHEAAFNDAIAQNNASALEKLKLPYSSQEEIYNYASGKNPYRYPNVNYYSDDYIRKAYNRSDATVEIQGGGTRAHFYTNINYYRAEDLINFGEAKDNYTDRFSVRGNVDLVVNKFITGWANVSATYYNEHKNKGDFWSDAATMHPNEPANASPLLPLDMVDPNASQTLSTLGKSLNIIDGKWFPGGSTSSRSYAIADCYFGGKTQAVSRQFQFDAGINYDMNRFVKGLTFKTLFSIDYAANYSLSYNNKYSVFIPTWSNYNTEDAIVAVSQPDDEVVTGTMTMSDTKYRQTITWNGHFDYDHTFARKHHVTGMLLANMYTTTASSTYHRYANANLGLEGGYDFMGRYFFEMGLAGVHSARLPEGNREALSHSFSLGWNIAKEKFMKGTGIDDLMISASISNLKDDADVYYSGTKYENFYLYDAVWTDQNTTGFSWNEGANSAVATVSTSGRNPALDFVHRKEFSLSLRGSFFDKLLRMELTYFNTDMDGIIIQNPTLYPSHLKDGLNNSKFSSTLNNDIQNRQGLDFSVTAQKQFGQVFAQLGVVGTYLTTEWTKKDENKKFDWLKDEGHAIDAIRGYKCIGFYTIDDFNYNPEAKAPYSLKEGVVTSSLGGKIMPGDLKYEDIDGNGKIDTNDQVDLGKNGAYGAPWTIGVNLTLKYKNWTLFMLGNGQFGACAMKNNSYYYMQGDNKYSVNVRDHIQYVFADDDPYKITGFVNPNATHPRLNAAGVANNNVASTYWMYSTDRFNIRKVQLTYDFPKELFDGKWVKALSVYVNGNDLLTISKNRKIMETSIGYAPQTRFYNLGVKVTL
ncbi:MAG: SusC/RagA family TonB-linked outer membrane protein [Prevotella sp.]|nr:SusC/RagA family TonB-linked outer membrane protein [Prevotella sp.]